MEISCQGDDHLKLIYLKIEVPEDLTLILQVDEPNKSGKTSIKRSKTSSLSRSNDIETNSHSAPHSGTPIYLQMNGDYYLQDVTANFSARLLACLHPTTSFL